MAMYEDFLCNIYSLQVPVADYQLRHLDLSEKVKSFFSHGIQKL